MPLRDCEKSGETWDYTRLSTFLKLAVRLDGPVAQWKERPPAKWMVEGSNPSGATQSYLSVRVEIAVSEALDSVICGWLVATKREPALRE